MSKGPVFTETYFPPPGSARQSDAGTWFPMRLLTEHFGTCTAAP